MDASYDPLELRDSSCHCQDGLCIVHESMLLKGEWLQVQDIVMESEMERGSSTS